MICDSLSMHYTIGAGFCREIVEFLESSKLFSENKIHYQLLDSVADMSSREVWTLEL